MSTRFMTSAEIREAFLSFFESKGHQRVQSSSLVPANDPTLLFTNAGMNQFKDCFLGLEKRAYVRATTSQKCVRAGGKHNDLDNVGYTARHHTFFEMLGNFSFGDYFKKDALAFAWEFLTSKEIGLGLEPERLYVTVYHTDDEAYDIWHKDIGLPTDHIIRIGDKGAKYESDNFWAMGDTGPCGPCSEIFYDHGDHIWGGLPGTPEEDGDRFVEIWNNVFMQFNRTADGVLHPLPAPSVDTGMGLERVSAVMQHVNSNYDTDIFQHLLKAIAQIVGTDNLDQPSLRVIADHARSCCFLIADGVNPSNEGRGYVLRRIIRRAVRHGYKLGVKETFFYKMLNPLIEVMGQAYPELAQEKQRIETALIKEEEQFAKTLEQGMKLLDEYTAQLVTFDDAFNILNDIQFFASNGTYYTAGIYGAQRQIAFDTEYRNLADRGELRLIKSNEWGKKVNRYGTDIYDAYITLTKEIISRVGETKTLTLDGKIVFKLYDTYGFPADLTADIARERNLTIDEAGFEREMNAQRQRARDAGKFAIDYNSIVKVDSETQFDGYTATQGQGNIIAIYKDGVAVDEVVEGDDALIVLDQTPFYAESGGQVGDTGTFKNDTGIFEVHDTKKSGSAFVHQGVVTVGRLAVNQAVNAQVQAELRQAIMRNHSATHLLHAALRQVLGTHVQQKGSLVASDILRFDFSHGEAVTLEQLDEIERLVNREIIANTPVITEVLDIETAKTKGAMMLFGEKYGETVRVLTMGTVNDDKPFSIELCGGIHVGSTGQIGLFKFVSEGGIASGVRRVEAVTGMRAIEVMQQQENTIRQIDGILKAQKNQTLEKVQLTVSQTSALQKQIEQLNQKLANFQANELIAQVQDIAGRKTLIAKVENIDVASLRHLHDSLKSKLNNAVIVLAGVDGDKVGLIASVAQEYHQTVKAGDIIKHLATELGGKGGGKPDLAQGGATYSAQLEPSLANLVQWLATK